MHCDVQTFLFDIEPDATTYPFSKRLTGRPGEVQDHALVRTHTQLR
jgi:hypothetical protein